MKATILALTTLMLISSVAAANHGGIHNMPPKSKCVVVQGGTPLFPTYTLVCK
jgi:hypothetical protein